MESGAPSSVPVEPLFAHRRVPIRMGVLHGYVASSDGWKVVALVGNVTEPVDRYTPRLTTRYVACTYSVDPEERSHFEYAHSRRVAAASVPGRAAALCAEVFGRYVADTGGFGDPEGTVDIEPADGEDPFWILNFVKAYREICGAAERPSIGRPYLFQPSTLRTVRILERTSPWLEDAVGASAKEGIVGLIGDERSASDPAVLARIMNEVGHPSKRVGAVFDDDFDWTRRAVGCVNRFHRRDGSDSRNSAVRTLEILSIMPQSWIPEDHVEYEAARVLSQALHRTIAHDVADIRRLLSGAGKGWAAFLAGFGPEAGTEAGFKAVLDAVSDMVRHVARELVVPCIPKNEIRHDHLFREIDEPWDVARAMVTPDGGLPLLVERSDRWHAVQARLPVLWAPDAETWKAPSPPFVRDGLEMRFLVSGAELEEEGSAQGHCVASFLSACAAGTTHVASIRSGGKRASTVEIVVRKGRPHVRQHRSAFNGMPPEGAERLLAGWIDAVASGTHPFDPPGPRRVRSPLLRVPETGSPSDWRGILQPRLAAMDWPTLIEEIRRMNRTWPRASRRSHRASLRRAESGADRTDVADAPAEV